LYWPLVDAATLQKLNSSNRHPIPRHNLGWLSFSTRQGGNSLNPESWSDSQSKSLQRLLESLSIHLAHI
jgi:hypothetical protein